MALLSLLFIGWHWLLFFLSKHFFLIFSKVKKKNVKLFYWLKKKPWGFKNFKIYSKDLTPRKRFILVPDVEAESLSSDSCSCLISGKGLVPASCHVTGLGKHKQFKQKRYIDYALSPSSLVWIIYFVCLNVWLTVCVWDTFMQVSAEARRGYSILMKLALRVFLILLTWGDGTKAWVLCKWCKCI